MDKYIRTVIEFKNNERTIFEKRTAEVIKNYKFKIDILVSEDELEILNNMSLKNASSYLKTKNFDN